MVRLVFRAPRKHVLTLIAGDPGRAGVLFTFGP